MTKKITALTLAAGFLAIPLSAKVSFSLDIEALMKADGATPIANDGLLVLVVDAGDDGFSMPSAGSFVGGNDEVVTTWDLSKAQFEIAAGETAFNFLTSGGVTYESDWEGDNLALFWYPGLSEGQTPAADSAFGAFADSFGLTSGDGWQMPGDGTLLHSLKLFTASASKFVMFGDVPNAIGQAAYAVNDASFPGATAPTDLELSHVGGDIKVAWSGSSQKGGFIVQRMKSGTSIWETVGAVENGVNTFTDTFVEAGAKYDYRLVAINGFQSATSLPEFIEALRSRIINLASRAVMGDTAVTRRGIGFSVTGADSLPVLIQAVGPSMGGTLPKPLDTKLWFYYAQPPEGVERLIAENDEWDIDAAEALEILEAQDKTGATVLGDEAGDSALLVSVTDVVGGYTSQVLDPLGEGGISSVQVYDLNYFKDNPADARLTGLSTRGVAGTGAESMRGSFIIDGPVPLKVIIRAKGPNLRDKEANDQWTSDTVCDDPTLKVLKWNGTAFEEIAFNDNWEDSSNGGATKSEIEAIQGDLGMTNFDTGSKDSLYMATFEPGQYTTEVLGVGGEVGTVTVEIYEVP